MSHTVPARLCPARRASAMLIAIGVVLTFLSVDAYAGNQTRAPHPRQTGLAPSLMLAELEKTFWMCDYAATVIGLLDWDTALACGEATRDLRLRKFEDDFDAMWLWWRKHKLREHRAIEEAYRRITAP